MEGRLNHKVAIVTGGGSGFGAGIVKAFVSEGASVVVADINKKAAMEVASAVSTSRCRAIAIRMDVTSQEESLNAIAVCEHEFGGLDILVANAGIIHPELSFMETTRKVLEQQFAVNTVGAMLSCQAAIPALRRRPGSCILITNSGMALTPRPHYYGYGMAKSATRYMINALALELAPENIRVNGLFPAAGDTQMLKVLTGGGDLVEGRQQLEKALPLGKLISPHDIGMAAVFLASSHEAAAITGCMLPIDSGRCI